MRVLGLEDHAWVFLVMRVLGRRRSRLVHQDGRSAAYHVVGSAYDWALAMVDCPDLLRRHLIEVLVHEAAIVVERIAGWL